MSKRKARKMVKTAVQEEINTCKAFRKAYAQMKIAETKMNETWERLMKAKDFKYQTKGKLDQLGSEFDALCEETDVSAKKTKEEIGQLKKELELAEQEENKLKRRLRRDGYRSVELIQAANENSNRRSELNRQLHLLIGDLRRIDLEAQEARSEKIKEQEAARAAHKAAKESHQELEKEYAEAKRAYLDLKARVDELRQKFNASRNNCGAAKAEAKREAQNGSRGGATYKK